MILKDELFPIGQITKPHGRKGEMAFTIDSTVLEDLDASFIVMEPDGILVPFYIENVRMKTIGTGLIKLERVDSEEQAREYIGQTIYLTKEFLEEIDDEEFETEYFIGFEMIDNDKGSIGQVTAIDDSTANALFIVESGRNEILIPIVEEFIAEIDHEKEVIHLTLPDGLLDL